MTVVASAPRRAAEGRVTAAATRGVPVPVAASTPRRAAEATGTRPARTFAMQACYVLGSPSTWVCCLASVLVCGLLGTVYMLVAGTTEPGGPSRLEIGFAATSVLVLTAMVAGCVAGSQEWSSGQHLYVFAAVPSRSALLGARWAVVAAVWAVAGGCAGLGLVVLDRVTGDPAVGPGPAGTVWLVAGTALAAAQAAVLGVNIATLLRSTVLSVVTTVAVATVVPLVTALHAGLRSVLPTTSLAALSSLPADGAGSAPLVTAIGVTLAWTGLSGAAALVRLTRSDL